MSTQKRTSRLRTVVEEPFTTRRWGQPSSRKKHRLTEKSISEMSSPGIEPTTLLSINVECFPNR